MARVDRLRDYDEWHHRYDDPGSTMSWPLGVVQEWLAETLDARPGPLSVISVCAGDGRDVLEVLATRDDADRVSVALLELHPEIAQRARDTARAGLPRVEVRTVDAGITDAYVGAAPADIVLLIGIFGNISRDDLDATIAASPQLCRPGATLLWSRGRDRDDLNDDVRRQFCEAGFSELRYAALERDSRPALGAMRYDGPTQPLEPGQRLFTFWR